MQAVTTADYGMEQINSVLSDYQELLVKANKQGNTTESELRNLKETPEGLKKAASSFESLFIHMLFQEMRKSVHSEDGIFPASMATEMWQDMLDQKTSENMAASDSLGIAKIVVRSFEKYVDPKKTVHSKVDELG
jgi:Rod binding domain-containing protein